MTSPPRILHFAKYYPPELGGMESVTQVLAEGMAQAGYPVQVLCFTKDKAGKAQRHGVAVIRVPVELERASQPLGWRYFFQGMQAARRADIVHLHAPNLLAALMCLLLPRRVKVLVHWHSDVVGKGRLAALVQPLERRMLQRADVAVATSQAYADASPLLVEVAHKMQVIPIGIPPPPAEAQAAQRHFDTFLAGRQFVLALGRLVPYKGFSVLIDAARHLPAGCAVVIGGGGPLAGELADQVRRLGLQDRVLLAGRLSDAELEHLFSRTLAFCLPSIERSEAFGVVLLEAMARGVPCVGTTIMGSGTSWVNLHGVSGLNVPPADSMALAACIQSIHDNPAQRAALAAGAAARFQALFTAQQSVAGFSALYRRLVHGH
jgi:glycosyltransferase involved in cell wall biosynthesis